MRTLIISCIATLFLANSAAAETIQVHIEGLVCAFCVKGIEKSFKKDDAVKSVKVDLDEKLVTLVTKPAQTLDNKTITQTVTDAGFNVTDITRAP